MHRIKWFVFNMNRHCQDGIKRRMLQGYQHCKIHHIEKILPCDYDAERLVSPRLRMNGIVSLDMSSPVPLTHDRFFPLVNVLALIIPNLRTLDISNLNVIPDYSDSIAQRWNHLEILKWNNNDEYWFDPNGLGLKSFTNYRNCTWMLVGLDLSFTHTTDLKIIGQWQIWRIIRIYSFSTNYARTTH